MIDTLTAIFQNTADAIREKTGDTATIAPADFATAISGITTGNSGSLSDWGWVGAEGTYKNSESTTVGATTVTHGLGVVPDFIYVYCKSNPSETDSYAIINSHAFSDYLKTSLGLSYAQRITRMTASMNIPDGFDTCADAETYGSIRNVNEETFTIGDNGEYFYHSANTEYGFIVMGRKATE